MDGDNHEKATRELGDPLGIPGYTGATPLGAGGFGLVYKARQTAFDREVAVKVLAAPLKDDAVRKRFERECKAIGALSGHPHIVTVYDSGMDAFGRPYIAMDYMPGGSFADRVRVEGALPWQEVLAIGVRVASAVATAHDARILHRDIKPENVLISAYGEPKLGDFGISAVPGAYQTQSGVITGSLSYAAPETFDGRAVGVASDLYSLGATLFFLATGRPPFFLEEDGSIPALISRILNEPVPDLRLQGLPDSFCEVLEIVLHKDPERRPASATDLGAALQKAQSAEGLVTTSLPLASSSARPGVRATEQPHAGPGEGNADLTRRRRDRPVRSLAEPVARVQRRRRPRLLLAGAFSVALLAAASVGVASGWIDVSTDDRGRGSAAAAFAPVTPRPPTAKPSPDQSPKEPRGEGKKEVRQPEKDKGRRPGGRDHARGGKNDGRRFAPPVEATGATGGAGGAGGTGGDSSSGGLGPDLGNNPAGGIGPTPDPQKPPGPGPVKPSSLPQPPTKQPPVQIPASMLPSAPPQG